MRFINKSYNDIFNNAVKNITARTNLDNLNADSKYFAIVSSILNENQKVLSNAQNVLDSINLFTASGSDLDLIGESRGIKRLPALKATVKAVEQNIKFFVESGTFGTINNNNNIVIPAGTIIYLDNKDSLTGEAIEFITTTENILSATSSVSYISAEAINTGIKSNIAANSLNKHNFTNYTDVNNNSLKVINLFSILNGRDIQTDNQYRYVISKSWTAFSNGNATGAMLLTKTIPGIKECKILQHYNGIGTTGILIDTWEGQVSDSLLDATTSKMKTIFSAGEVVNAYKPQYIALQFSLTLKTKIDLSSNEKTKLSNSVLLYIRNYINSFSIGQSFDGAELLNNIINNFNVVTDIGTNLSFDILNVYTIDSFNQYNYKVYTSNTVTIEENQKVILLDNTNTPVTISIRKV